MFFKWTLHSHVWRAKSVPVLVAQNQTLFRESSLNWVEHFSGAIAASDALRLNWSPNNFEFYNGKFLLDQGPQKLTLWTSNRSISQDFSIGCPRTENWQITHICIVTWFYSSTVVSATISVTRLETKAACNLSMSKNFSSLLLSVHINRFCDFIEIAGWLPVAVGMQTK